MNMRVEFAGVAIALPDGWFDVTPDAGGPSTLARPEGIGAVQLSVAKYKKGAAPAIDRPTLRGLLFDFGKSRGLGVPTNVTEGEGCCQFVAGDFNSDADLVHVWYVSNGSDVALVTYLTQQPLNEDVPLEVRAAHEMVESLEF